MASIRELIAGMEVELEAAQKREQKANKEAQVILATAQQEGRSALTEEEDQRCEQLSEAKELAKSQQEGIKAKLARALKVEADEAEAEERLKETVKAPKSPRSLPKYDEVMRVGSEERTYHQGNDPEGSNFLQDVARNFLYNDVGANSRLARHMQEERVERHGMVERVVAGSPISSDFNGLVVPQYLIDMTAPKVANMRPFADVANHHVLPAAGLSFVVPTITTATSVTTPADELTAVAAVSIGETDKTVSVRTAAGQQTLSRASIDRGTGIEGIVLADLMKRYHTELDRQMLNATTNGLHTIATRNEYDDAAPTGAALYPRILGAASKSEQALLAMGAPDVVLMHGRRWYWLQSEMTDTWPLINQPQVPVMAAGTATSAGYGNGVRGVLPCGLRVVVDNNISCLGLDGDDPADGGGEDILYVGPTSEAHLWEEAGAPLYIRAEQPAAARLGVLLVVYGYFAFTFERYAGAFQKIDGTGTGAPTGF